MVGGTGEEGEMAAQEIWAPALAPAAQDANALGEKKRREEREKKEKERGFEPRALRRRAREGGGGEGGRVEARGSLKD